MNGRFYSCKVVVSDLDRSLAFYSGVFGLREVARLNFTDPDITEVLLEDETGGRRVILMNSEVLPVPSCPGWSPLVLEVDDVQAAREELAAAGFEVAFEPVGLGPLSIFMAADPDGYLIEIFAGEMVIDNLPTDQKIPHPVPHIHAAK
ncbi:VOC family protein [Streptomyces sp. NPDC004286]|uniref:VOC family protein n=1 Tax=Streptomyces sp. NPDC004286 TaxID=3364696 RepID=UPI0036D0ED8B